MANKTKTKTAKNLAKIICNEVIGLVIKVSIVPEEYSSVKTRILTAGINNKKKNGAVKKNISMSA
jgi:hypothetical protein